MTKNNTNKKLGLPKIEKKYKKIRHKKIYQTKNAKYTINYKYNINSKLIIYHLNKTFTITGLLMITIY